MREEAEKIEIEVEVGEAKAFYLEKGANSFKNYLTQKRFMEERAFKKLVSPFKEEIKRRGWENMSKHMELRR